MWHSRKNLYDLKPEITIINLNIGAPETPQIMEIEKIIKRACPKLLGRVFPEEQTKTLREHT
jgi:aspartate/methionine/tyrosine aminotransferase